MAKRRIETWLTLMVGAGGLVIAAVLGLWTYMSATATLLHPNPTGVPSVAHSAPVRGWSDAVDQARQIVRTALAEQNLPGLSVAVGAGGGVIWAEGFGWADLENRVRVTPDTSFRIGTASTAFTSAAVGVLLDKGRLTLDEPVQRYVPEFPKKEWPVTVRQLMAHTSGLRNDGGDEASLLSQRCARPVDALQHFAQQPLLFEPDTRHEYSSHGWVVVSAAAEAVANEPFLLFMRNQIFEPLGMRDTKPDSTSEPIASRATSYFPRFAADPRYGPDVMRPVDYSCYAGASVFLSTPSDLVRFAIGVNGTLLQPATVQLLQTSQRLRSGEDTGHGLGWELGSATLAGKDSRWVGRDGTLLGGMVASLMTFPDHGIVVSVVSNTSYADTGAVALNIAQVFAAGED